MSDAAFADRVGGVLQPRSQREQPSDELFVDESGVGLVERHQVAHDLHLSLRGAQRKQLVREAHFGRCRGCDVGLHGVLPPCLQCQYIALNMTTYVS